MKIFTVYSKPGDNIDKSIFIKEGFSIYAFLFQFFWALYNRLWQLSILFIVISMSLNLFLSLEFISVETLYVIDFVMFLFIGIEANDILRYYLERRGYECLAVIAANNYPEAQFRFFKEYVNIDEKYEV